MEYFERAARQADFANWDEGSFDIRLELLSAAIYADAKVMFPTFAWLLARVDERPDRHAPYLLTGYRYVIQGAIYHFPTISLEQINHMLGDFSHRLENHGYSSRRAMDCRLDLSIHLGELDTAAQLAKQISVLARDDLADCEACEQHQLVWLAYCRHDHAEAMKLAQPMLNGELSCNSEPERTCNILMLIALRENDLELAEEMHLRDYPLISHDDLLDSIGYHAIYLARVRNTSKALDLIREHIGRATNASPLGDRVYFFAGALAVTRLALKTGSTTLAVRLPESHPAFNATSPEECHLRKFAEWLEREIQSAVAAFDARNGTKHYSATLQQLISLARV